MKDDGKSLCCNGCCSSAVEVKSKSCSVLQVFRQDELQHLLHLLRESSVAVLNQNKDPLGYEIE